MVELHLYAATFMLQFSSRVNFWIASQLHRRGLEIAHKLVSCLGTPTCSVNKD